jgi:hypothetical protein
VKSTPDADVFAPKIIEAFFNGPATVSHKSLKLWISGYYNGGTEAGKM